MSIPLLEELDSKLREINTTSEMKVALADMYALGLHIFRNDNQVAGRKICTTVMRAANFSLEFQERLREMLNKNEIDNKYSIVLRSHSEMIEYCR